MQGISGKRYLTAIVKNRPRNSNLSVPEHGHTIPRTAHGGAAHSGEAGGEGWAGQGAMRRGGAGWDGKQRVDAATTAAGRFAQRKKKTIHLALHGADDNRPGRLFGSKNKQNFMKTKSASTATG